MASYFDEHYLLTHGQSHSADDSRAEALAATRLAGVSPGARILDAPCGFGRHAIPLAEAGFDVVGLDFSEPLLAEARSRLGQGGPELVRGDLRALPFEAASFDAVLCLYNSLGYDGEEGDLQTLRELRRVLRTGGRLVLEAYHRDRLAQAFRPRAEVELPDGSVSVAESEFDVVGGVLTVRETRSEAGAVLSERTYSQRIYSATELVRLVGYAGFGKIGCCGDLNGSLVRLDAPIVVVVAE
jgi:SAM-dependent methyltransferase